MVKGFSSFVNDVCTSQWNSLTERDTWTHAFPFSSLWSPQLSLYFILFSHSLLSSLLLYASWFGIWMAWLWYTVSCRGSDHLIISISGACRSSTGRQNYSLDGCQQCGRYSMWFSFSTNMLSWSKHTTDRHTVEERHRDTKSIEWRQPEADYEAPAREEPVSEWQVAWPQGLLMKRVCLPAYRSNHISWSDAWLTGRLRGGLNGHLGPHTHTHTQRMETLRSTGVCVLAREW